MKKCPNCKLTNPSDALRCDCGYDFPSGQVKGSYIGKIDSHAIPVDELPLFRMLARVCLVVTIILFGAILALRWDDSYGLLYLLPATLFVIVSCCYMRCKGYPWQDGWVGFFSIIGLCILMLKPYKVQPDVETSQEEN